jgi:hypothetical protein
MEGSVLAGALKRGRDISALFEGLLVSNGYRALLFFDLSRHRMQVAKTLLLGSAEASLRKEEGKSL